MYKIRLQYVFSMYCIFYVLLYNNIMYDHVLFLSYILFHIFEYIIYFIFYTIY